MSEYERGAEAAKVAYFAAMEDVRNASDWESLPAHVQTQWRRAAKALLGPDAYEYVVAAESLSTAARVVAAGGADDPAYLALQRAIMRFENTTWPEFGEDSEDVRFPPPPAPDADPKPDAVAKKRPRKDASAVLREIEDFLGHIAMNGADAKDREVALALEQDAHVLAAKPDAVAAARERFRDAAALAVIASITSAGSDQDERIKKAAWQTARTFFDAMREATEQAEREGGA